MQHGPDAGARFAERRAVPRFPFVAPLDILEPITRTHLSASTSEIGARGCHVDTASPLPPNTVVQISIQRDDASFQTWARVVYAHEGRGMGVQFFETLPEQERILRQWIAELAAAPTT
jgi:hypothetical protein